MKNLGLAKHYKEIHLKPFFSYLYFPASSLSCEFPQDADSICRDPKSHKQYYRHKYIQHQRQSISMLIWISDSRWGFGSFMKLNWKDSWKDPQKQSCEGNGHYISKAFTPSQIFFWLMHSFLNSTSNCHLHFWIIKVSFQTYHIWAKYPINATQCFKLSSANLNQLPSEHLSQWIQISLLNFPALNPNLPLFKCTSYICNINWIKSA